MREEFVRRNVHLAFFGRHQGVCDVAQRLTHEMRVFNSLNTRITQIQFSARLLVEKHCPWHEVEAEAEAEALVVALEEPLRRMALPQVLV